MLSILRIYVPFLSGSFNMFLHFRADLNAQIYRYVVHHSLTKTSFRAARGEQFRRQH